MPRDTQLGIRGLTNLALWSDVWSTWSTFDSPRFAQWHARWVADLPVRPALPIAELSAASADRDTVITVSADFTRPLVIRGALRDQPVLRSWGDPRWWIERYPDTKLLCSTADASAMLPLREALTTPDVYVAGAATLFEHHPELKDMVETEQTRAMTPDGPGRSPQFYQAFMGRHRQGTTVHCAIGINLFRQISGRKAWYFIPPSQTPYVLPKIYANGYSATSRTIQPHGEHPGSPWFHRLERYQVTLEPGDLLINPPWWWHCVENLPSSDELVVGVPTRFPAGRRAIEVDPFKTFVLASRLLTGRSGIKPGREQDPAAFERSLIANRDQTDQQLVLRTGAPAGPDLALPPDDGRLDWADRVFVEFRRLYPCRRMIVVLALRLREAPDIAALRQRIDEFSARHPRLRWTLREDPVAPQWSAGAYSTASQVVERVVTEPTELDQLLSSTEVREGRHLDWRRPPWCVEVIRNDPEPSRATLHAVRLSWDHTISDVEGMLRMLIALGDSDAPVPVPPRPPLMGPPAGRWRALRDRCAALGAKTLRVSAGRDDVRWLQLEASVPVGVVDACATEHGVTAREVLITLSALAYARYRRARGESRTAFEILAPSYSERSAEGPLELGNHRRRSARFPIPAEPDNFDALLSTIATLAREAQGASYRRFALLGRLPDRLTRRALARGIPPVIVNWDAPRLVDRLHDLAGTPVEGASLAAPLLPHQQLSFIWWVRGGSIRCSLTADRDLVPELSTLASELGAAMDELRYR